MSWVSPHVPSYPRSLPQSMHRRLCQAVQLLPNRSWKCGTTPSFFQQAIRPLYDVCPSFLRTDAKECNIVFVSTRNRPVILYPTPSSPAHFFLCVCMKVVDFFKLPTNAALVLVDEVALDFGHIRLKGKGGSGGHNGLKSLQAHLKTPDYSRLRIGVGGETVRYWARSKEGMAGEGGGTHCHA